MPNLKDICKCFNYALTLLGWQFKCWALLDDAAILACTAIVSIRCVSAL